MSWRVWPVVFARLPETESLAQPKIDERQVLLCVLDADSELLADRPGLLLIVDKGYVSAELDDYLHTRGTALLRPSYRNRLPPGQQLAPIRQRIESLSETLICHSRQGVANGKRPSPAPTLVAARARSWPARLP
jgi:hypothetical protein